MRYHYPVFMPCEGTAEDRPCPENSVGMGILKVFDGGEGVGRAESLVPPKDWQTLSVQAPKVLGRREKCGPFESPWRVASGWGVPQTGVTCPKCSEHLKIEDMVVDSQRAAEAGKLQ